MMPDNPEQLLAFMRGETDDPGIVRVVRGGIQWPTPKEPQMGNTDHLRRDTLRLVAKAVRYEVEARLAEIGDGQGCEAAAARAFEHGRLQVVDVDMWVALGLTPPGPPPLA